MAKKVKLTYESALENQKKLKSEIKELSTELKEFKKTEGVTSKKPAKGKTLKSITALEKKIEGKKESLSTTNDFIKENKPAKTERSSKYNYPAWCDTSDKKKKFRTLVRSGVSEKDVTETMVELGKRAVAEKSEKPAKAKKEKVAKEKAPKKSKKTETETETKAPVKKAKKAKKAKKSKKSDD